MYISHKPFLIIISSPSGAGKSTLCKMVTQNDPLIKLSTSATTRSQRPQEVDGKDYYFIDEEKFVEMVDKSQFIEYANVFGNYYGTPKKMVDDTLKNGSEVIFDIDWQGARQVKKEFDETSVISIFILPPSLEELERRLRGRAQDPEEIVKDRMEKAIDEISHYDEYDYVIVNDDLNATYGKIKSIIEAKRVSRLSRVQISKLVKEFN